MSGTAFRDVIYFSGFVLFVLILSFCRIHILIVYPARTQRHRTMYVLIGFSCLSTTRSKEGYD